MSAASPAGVEGVRESAFLIGNGQITRLQGQRGTTPSCPEAKWQKGDILEGRKLRGFSFAGERGAVAVVVPPGFSPDWAMADLRGEPRPLMHQVPLRVVSYILATEAGRAILVKERFLRGTGEQAEVVIAKEPRA